LPLGGGGEAWDASSPNASDSKADEGQFLSLDEIEALHQTSLQATARNLSRTAERLGITPRRFITNSASMDSTRN
jgi:hypothetical protein